MDPQEVENKIDLVFKEIMSSEDIIDSTNKIVSKEDLPEWYDERLLKLGQDYACRNRISVTSCGIMGLVTILSMPDIRILKSTQKSSTPCAAFKRYLQTILHIDMFYFESIDDADSNWWKSMNIVRWKHATVARMAEENNIAKFYQQHMVLTQFGFVAYILLKSQEMGFTNEPEGVEGFVHLWRIIGYLLGIPDKMNLCRDNATETRLLCNKILNEFYIKNIENRTESRKPIIKSVLDGLSCIGSGANYDAFLRFFYELIGLKYNQPMSWRSQFIYLEKKVTLYALGIPYINHPLRYFFNRLLFMQVWLAQYFPVKAWMKFGRKNTSISLYPVSLKKS